MRREALVALVGLAMAGCVEPEGGSFQVGPSPAGLSVIDRGSESGYPGAPVREFVFTQVADWQRFWKLHAQKDTPASPAPQIAWSTHAVIALVHGRVPTGGHAIWVESAREDAASNEFRVAYKVRHPGDGCPVAQAETNPYYIASVAAEHGAKVRWSRTEVRAEPC